MWIRDESQKSVSTDENLRELSTPLHVAKKVGKSLGKRAVLLGRLSSTAEFQAGFGAGRFAVRTRELASCRFQEPDILLQSAAQRRLPIPVRGNGPPSPEAVRPIRRMGREWMCVEASVMDAVQGLRE